jgi:uncharacterized Zn finger protein (UPF0148 family)
MKKSEKIRERWEAWLKTHKRCPECGGRRYIPTIPAGKMPCPTCNETGWIKREKNKTTKEVKMRDKT